MFEGLIFDFDGLILETEEPCYRAWLEIYEEFEQPLPIEVWVGCIGRSADYFDPVPYLENKLGRPLDSEVLRARQRTRYHQLLDQTPLLPGVMDYVTSAQDLGLRLAVASSSSSSWVVGHLQRLGLGDVWVSVECWSEGRCAKPEPDLYLAAIKALGVPAERAVAFEDSSNGILAAKRAGLLCVAVPNDMTRGLDLSAADLHLPSLDAVPLPELLEQLRALQADGNAAELSFAPGA